jgi:hypothetical protein
MRGTMAGEGKIGPYDQNLICLTDEVDEAVRHITDAEAALAAEQEALQEAAAVEAAAAQTEAAEASSDEGRAS